MAAYVEDFLGHVNDAREGRLQLPGFQRDWKWKPGQVRLLFDSLRQGFPIGGFLFIKKSDLVNLSPREFRHAIEGAGKLDAERLVLDGQQRLTAGIELFHGSGDIHYFLNLNTIFRLCGERNIDFQNGGSVKKFLLDLDDDDKYIVAKKRTDDPRQYLVNRHLLWTADINDDDELTRALRRYSEAYDSRKDFADFVIGRNFKPAVDSNISVTLINADVPVEAISRIFATLNSTGKLLTPFELVVSILFPQGIKPAEDVEVAREIHPYYSRIDESGDIFLQTIALLSARDTKKASLPKTITPDIYPQHMNDAFKYLDDAAELLTQNLGLGLDSSSELLVYPVIYTPMAYVLKILSNRNPSTEETAKAKKKICQWYVGAVLSRRYQQSTHDKQARDKVEILRWIDGGDENAPQWLKDTYIPNLKISSPDSAMGKLLRCLLNARGLKDPLSGASVGVKSGAKTTSKHHVFPTRFVKNLGGWERGDTANLALNVMLIEQSTNASWLNLDPAIQINKVFEIQGEPSGRQILNDHGITDACINVLLREQKTKNDYLEFWALYT
ncbi:MAG: DUF262 domain-containing protein [Proteobacteria bacterium]|nr:DUF262 domain-containing protein [Pseudomonadota bacterium]